MSFTLFEVVPWGRSYDEYVSMFSLSSQDLRRNIVGCSDGPASFNSILTSKGGSIVSVDPLYAFSTKEIKKRIEETYDVVLDQTRKNRSEFVWGSISSVEELGRIRMSAMEEFLKDFDKGKSDGRYIKGSLPKLPFKNKEFDIALCSHFLFLYSDRLSEKFHIDSIKELCRVASQVRIFPLMELGAKKSRHLAPIISKLKEKNYQIDIKKVAYEFQKGGNELMIVESTQQNV